MNNSMDMTASQKNQNEVYIKNANKISLQDGKMNIQALMRSNISIFDLMNSENVRARKITKAVNG